MTAIHQHSNKKRWHTPSIALFFVFETYCRVTMEAWERSVHNIRHLGTDEVFLLSLPSFERSAIHFG
jgi:hypothetical protein